MRTISKVIVALLVIVAVTGASGIAIADDREDASDRESPCGATDHLEDDHDVGEGDTGVSQGSTECHEGTGT